MRLTKPFQVCRFGRLPSGEWAYTVVAAYTTQRAAENAAALRAGTFAPGLYRVRDERADGTPGEWVAEIDARPPGAVV